MEVFILKNKLSLYIVALMLSSFLIGCQNKNDSNKKVDSKPTVTDSTKDTDNTKTENQSDNKGNKTEDKSDNQSENQIENKTDGQKENNSERLPINQGENIVKEPSNDKKVDNSPSSNSTDKPKTPTSTSGSNDNNNKDNNATPIPTTPTTPTKPTETVKDKDLVTYKTDIKTEAIAYETITQNDSTLAKGTSKIVQNGVNGERTITYKVTLVNGKEISREVVSNVISKNPINKIVKVGTYVAPSYEPFKGYVWTTNDPRNHHIAGQYSDLADFNNMIVPKGNIHAIDDNIYLAVWALSRGHDADYIKKFYVNKLVNNKYLITDFKVTYYTVPSTEVHGDIGIRQSTYNYAKILGIENFPSELFSVGAGYYMTYDDTSYYGVVRVLITYKEI
jgi:hypothetical protein